MRALGFGLGVLVLSQSVQCFAKSLCEKECGFCLLASEKSNAFGDEQLRLHLGTRARSNLEEVTKLLRCISGEALGDVGGDGNHRTAELVSEREAFFRGQGLAQSVNFDHQVHAQLPNF